MRPTFRLESLESRLTPAVAFTYPAAVVPAGGVSRAVAVGDFNGDGRPDLVTVCEGFTATNSGSVSVILSSTAPGAPAPSFFSPLVMATPPYGDPVAVAVADFNGDGRSDLAVLNATGSSSSVSVFTNATALGSTAPAFLASDAFGVNAQPNGLVAADVNQDGRPDLLTSNTSGVVVRLNTTPAGAGDPAFSPADSFPGGASFGNLVLGDFNGDGRPDVVTADATGVSVRLNTTPVGSTTASFAPAHLIPGGGASSGNVIVGDFNADGRLDLATFQYISSRSASYTFSKTDLILLTNTTPAGGGVASFASSSQQLAFDVPAAASRISHAFAGDFNSDGLTDFATTSAVQNTGVTVYTDAVAAGAATATATFNPVYFPSATQFPLHAMAVGDLTGDGRPELALAAQGASGVSVLMNGTPDPALAPVSPVVGQFGGEGVWGLDRSTLAWQQLTAANATDLATAPNGSVVAAFGNDGVWYHRPLAGWSQVNGYPATAVAIDALGNATASFAGFGTATYRPAAGGWTLTTAAVADALASDPNGDVVGDFPGFGVYLFRPSLGWQPTPLTAVNAQALAVASNGDVVASFAGYGVYAYRAAAGGWRLLNGYAATALAVDGNGAVTASFDGFGVARYLPFARWWQPIAPAVRATSLAADWYGNVFATLTGAGVWEYSGVYGWSQRRASDGLLSVG